MKLDLWQRNTPTPPYTMLFSAAISISALSGRRGRYAHAYGICVPFYCISLKNMEGGGYNAARGLISRDIAVHTLLLANFYSLPIVVHTNFFIKFSLFVLPL